MTKSQKQKNKIRFRLPWIGKFLFPALVFQVALISPSPAVFLHDFQNKPMDGDKNETSVPHGFHKEKQILQSLKPRPGYSVSLDSFLINLSQNQGQTLFKMEVKLNVDNLAIQSEINKRMPQIRDIIIILVSSKKYEDISTIQGQDSLRMEIQETINSFLTKGKINKVLFTEFIET